MASEFSGGCRCGQIRYTCSAEPMFTGHCHCRDCQYASGGAYSTIVGVATDALALAGELAGYTVDTDSGNQVTRRFCPTCGTPILSELSASPAMTVLKAASLDDPSWLTPAMHIWTASGQPWAETSPDSPKFAKDPG